LTFPPGTSQLSVPVRVFGDVVAEPDETFSLLLSNPVNASLAQTMAVAVITNDDLSLISINDVTVTELPGAPPRPSSPSL